MKIFLSLLLAFVGAGCDYIQEARFTPDDNLEKIQLSLIFTDKVKLKLAKQFSIKDYGYVEINKYTDSQPFSLDLNLKTSIVDEQDYLKLTPTFTLPNGIATGVPWALAEVRSPQPLDPLFDLMAYVDIAHRQWLGVAVLFGFADSEDLPRDLSVSQVFKRDKFGQPALMATVFGPQIASNGSVKRAPGAAIFVNFKELIEATTVKPGENLKFYGEPSERTFAN